jgi:hypothetical protein
MYSTSTANFPTFASTNSTWVELLIMLSLFYQMNFEGILKLHRPHNAILHRLFSMRATEVYFEQFKEKISYSDNHNLLLIGSCFTENISAKLKYYKFGNQVSVNPQGILFNPVSISRCLNNLVNRTQFVYSERVKSDCLFVDQNHPDIIHSWDHHSSFSSLLHNVDNMINSMNCQVLRAADHLQSCLRPILFLTLGSAFIHQLVDSNRVVANCHKQPASLFTKQLLTQEKITHDLKFALLQCKEKLNRNLQVESILISQSFQLLRIQVVFTVSPIRHTKEGLSENSLSKVRIFQTSSLSSMTTALLFHGLFLISSLY